MAAQTALATSLRRVALLKAVLALIAGVLGMHILLGSSHSMPQSLTASPVAAASDAHHGETVAHATPGHEHQVSSSMAEGGTLAQVQCSCPGNCPSGHVMAGSCIPSAATGSLSAPLPDSSAVPGSTLQAIHVPAGTPQSYLPSSPSPGELSISRT